jgi:hypothetical protein
MIKFCGLLKRIDYTQMVSSPRMMVFSLISFLQKWKILLSEGKKKMVD